MDQQEDIDSIARTMLAEYGMRAPEVVNERAIKHIEVFEIEGALLWSQVAKALGKLRRVAGMREPTSRANPLAAPVAAPLYPSVQRIAFAVTAVQPESEELREAAAARLAAAEQCLMSKATRSASVEHREQAAALRLSSAKARALYRQARTAAAGTSAHCAA